MIGGLFGNDHQWKELERRWHELLARPGDLWSPLSRFHMYDCEHGDGEFSGHSRGARDHLIYKFRNLILDSGLHGYAIGISAPDWAELVTGERLAAWGDPERQCVMNCLWATLQWASRASVEREVAFVFDDRPARRESNRRLFSLYQYWSEQKGLVPKPTGLAFLSSDKIIPLQAADMFAWESNRWMKDDVPSRPHFSHFLKTRRFYFSFGNRAQIQAMLAETPTGSDAEGNLSRIAAYFRSPSPDPSTLPLP